MVLPVEVLERLHHGHEVAAEVHTALPDMRAFVMVIPRVPPVRRDRGLWNEEAWIVEPGKRPRLSDPALIAGYEVRYLLHLAKYTLRMGMGLRSCFGR